MDKIREQYNINISQTIINNLEKRGMEGFYCSNKEEASSKIIELVGQNSSVAWGGSETLKELDIFKKLSDNHNILIDRKIAKTDEEKRKIYGETVMSDNYLTSTNAITIDGQLVNIDGSGNRVACIIHGPKQVLVIAGVNKIVSDVESGIKRVRNIAAPKNTVRLNCNTPCNEKGRCMDCLVKDSICSHIVVTRRSGKAGRIKVILVGEELGY